jgi:hypothetical protein
VRMVGGSGYGVRRLLGNLGIGSIRPKSLLLYQRKSCRGIVLCFISIAMDVKLGRTCWLLVERLFPHSTESAFKIGRRNSQLTVIKTTRFPSTSFHLSTKALTRATRSSSPAGGFCVWKYDSVLKGVDAMAIVPNKVGLSRRGRGNSRLFNLAGCYEKPASPYSAV